MFWVAVFPWLGPVLVWALFLLVALLLLAMSGQFGPYFDVAMLIIYYALWFPRGETLVLLAVVVLFPLCLAATVKGRLPLTEPSPSWHAQRRVSTPRPRPAAPASSPAAPGRAPPPTPAAAATAAPRREGLTLELPARRHRPEPMAGAGRRSRTVTARTGFRLAFWYLRVSCYSALLLVAILTVLMRLSG